MVVRNLLCVLAASFGLFAQNNQIDAPALTPRPAPPAAANQYVVETGTRIPLSLINSVSTKNASVGDRVYLETVFPILVNGRIVIPPGSYVAGTVTDVRRPGRVKGRGELHVRFDSLTLANGTTRDFRAVIGSLDGRAAETFDKKEGGIKSEGNKGGDAQKVADMTVTGASVGALAGLAGARPGMGAGIGAAAGAAAGLAGVLLTRGPDAMLSKGTTVEMVVDRDLRFAPEELDTTPVQRMRAIGEGPGPAPSVKERQSIRRFPL